MSRLNISGFLFKILPARFYITFRNMIEGGYDLEIKMIKEALEDVVGRILDIGCGNGETGSAGDGKNVVGMDSDAGLLSYAVNKGYNMLVCGDIGVLPFIDEVFSAVVFCKLGHHLDDTNLKRALDESRRVLMTGGKIVLIDPFPPSANTTFMHNLIARIEIGSHHRSSDSMKEFLGEFRIAGEKHFRKGSYDLYLMECIKTPPDTPTRCSSH
jgi:SAM-dependent methyltransferase